ncbi:hypothetical protein Tco_0386174 [Tanacetum coccineum]
MKWHPEWYSAASDSRGVTDCVMDMPTSPDHVFDFPADEPEPVEAPVNMNSWIEWDEPVGNPEDDGEEDSDIDLDDDDEGEEEEEN